MDAQPIGSAISMTVAMNSNAVFRIIVSYELSAGNPVYIIYKPHITIKAIKLKPNIFAVLILFLLYAFDPSNDSCKASSVIQI